LRNEALDLCPWLCTAPQGPDTPFAWPAYLVVDSLRVLIVVAAVVLIAATVWTIHRSPARGQKLRFLGVVPLYLYVVQSELSHLGDQPHSRFITGLAGTAIMLWGYWEHLSCERPASRRRKGCKWPPPRDPEGQEPDP
jgi:hypothetical protein